MTETFDVIVLGGGAVGSACARELAHGGRRVLVIERGTEQGEGWRAAAGMLAPQIENKPGNPLFKLGLAGRQRLIELAGVLAGTTGIDIGLWQGGIGRLATSEAETAALRSAVAWQRQEGHLCEWLDADAVRSRWPFVDPSFGALWAPRDAALNPVALVAALRADAERLGARIVHDTAIAIEHEGERVTGVAGLGNRYRADQVVLAAGAWSGQLKGVPRPVAVAPVRGQMAAFPWPAAIPPVVLYSRRCYMVYRGGEAVIGSTMEYVGFEPEVTSAGLSRIVGSVAELCPALSGLAPHRTWAGLRPVTPDGNPIIGAEPRMRGLWYATGHGRNGILLSAITGVIIRQLLDGEPGFEELSALAPERFWTW